jgi:hypothetical protein
MSNPNARDMFASSLANRLIDICIEAGYYRVQNQKDKLKQEISSKYGDFSYEENRLSSFMAAAALSITKLFPDAITADMVFSFHQASLLKFFDKLQKLNEKEKSLDNVVKSLFLGKSSLEDLKNSATSLVNNDQKQDIEYYFELYNEGELKFVDLVGNIGHIFRGCSKDILEKMLLA